MRIKASRPVWSWGLLLALVIACDETGTSRPKAVVRDSAGTAIVENALPETAPAYSVSGPVLAIGKVEGAAEYELHDVTGVVRLSDGSIAVATGSEIRWYDADGSFRHRAGGAGSGPGEFRSIRYMRSLRGDSLLVFDNTNRRVTILAPDGGYVRSETTSLDEERPLTVAGALRDGTLLTRTVLETPPASTPLYRMRMEFAVSRNGTSQPLRPYLGPDAALHAEGSGGGINSVFISLLPFARAAHAAAGQDRFFVGSSDSFQIDVWDAAARLVRIIRVPVTLKPVTEEVRQAYIERELERRRQSAEERGQPFEEAAVRRYLDEQRHAPAVPAYGALLATADGGLWVKDFTMPGVESVPERWTIFDAEGGLAAIIDLPPRFTPRHVEGGVVLGVFRDSLDVPYVHVYTFGSDRLGQAEGIAHGVAAARGL